MLQLLMLLLAVWSLMPSTTADGGPATGGAGEASVLVTAESADPASTWRTVLQLLDRRRAQAWRVGDPSLLRGVYMSESPALRRDQRRLAAYLRRGLTVSGVHTAYARVRVVRRGHARVVLDVVDRLADRPVAHGRHGYHRRLPRDRPTAHRLWLRKAGSRWRIAQVHTLSRH